MAAQPVLHPSEDALRAFALGKLDDTTSSVLRSHLDACSQCCKIAAALSGDDFLNRLRQAHGYGNTPAPADPLSASLGASKPPPSASQTPIPHLPPELAANQQYEILRELGRGGMGVVYLAKNKPMDRLEVLKVVNTSLLDRPGAVERFLREIRSAAKLNHANVVTAYSVLQQGGLLAFAMEYIEGQDLANVVKAQGPLPVAHACYYVQQAALGLQHAYEEKMVHRDIKPQNLILTRKGKKHLVKVLDFGLAKVMREKSEDTGLTGEGKMLGTPDYIAPEQSLDAAKADIRADIYSLGCTLYYLLSGRPPFSGNSLGAVLMAHQMQEAKPLNLVRPEVPEELAAVVRKMMAKAPAKRYQTPLEVVQALAPFVKQTSGVALAPRVPAAPELSSGTAEAKPAAKKAARVHPPPPVAASAKKQPEPAVVWESLTEDSIASVAPRKSAVLRQRRAATVRERTAPKKWLIGGGVGMAVLVLALLGMWAGDVFKGKPPDGRESTFKDGDRIISTARRLPEKTEKHEVKADAPPPEKPAPSPDTKKPDAPRVAGTADDDKGFVLLFNGKDLTGWNVTEGGRKALWGAENGVLHTNGSSSGWLMTEKAYSDFELRLEFKLSEKGNSGVALRSAMKGNPARDAGMEIQLLDDDWYTKNFKDMKPELRTGSIWGIIPPSRNALEPIGEWNALRIVAKGRNVTVVLNGTEIVNANLDAYKNKVGTHPGMQRTTGHIGLQSSDSHVEFRKIEIKELPAAKAETLAATDAAVPLSPRRAESSLPPEAKAAAKAFEKARDDARAKFLAEFDTVLDRLAKRKGSTGPRLQMINVVKEEKARFDNRGLIPWSEPMRPYLAKYFASISAAEYKLRRAYNSLMDTHIKAKNESKVADLQADLTNLIGVRLLAKWRVITNGRPPGWIACLYSNGRIYGIDGNATKGAWSYSNGVLIYRWPDPMAPGGVWLDTSSVSADGTEYVGTNNAPPRMRAQFKGVYLKDE